MRQKSNSPGRKNMNTPLPQQPFSPPPPKETPVTRYIHPIQANPLFQEGPPIQSDPLVTILDTLARHTNMLEELLRRTETSTSDTI